MVSPAKKLKSVVRPFISAVAASTASRRGLAAAQAPSFIPKSAASSKSKQSAAKLLTAKYRNFFEPDAEPHETTNETVARLKELAEEQNCWVAELLLDLCPLEPDADPVLLDAFSLANIKSGSCFYFPSKHKPKVLLAAAWTTKEESARLQRNPEVIGPSDGGRSTISDTAAKAPVTRPISSGRS